MQPMLRLIAPALALTIAGLTPRFAATQPAPAGPPPDPNRVLPGEFLIDPPTLQNLGFEWFIEGDANRNAEVRFI